MPSPLVKISDNSLSAKKSSKKVPKPKLTSFNVKPGQSFWLRDLEPLEGCMPSSGGGASQVINTE